MNLNPYFSNDFFFKIGGGGVKPELTNVNFFKAFLTFQRESTLQDLK